MVQYTTIQRCCEKFGSDDDQRKFKVYEECELVPYLYRSIFEIPSKSFGPGDITTGLVSLHLFLPDDVIIEISVEKHFAHDITKKIYTFSGNLAQVL